MYHWNALSGKFEHQDDTIIFRGKPITFQDVPGPSVGTYITDQRFSGGTITGQISFQQISQSSTCEFILSYQPVTQSFVTAGIGGAGMFCVRSFDSRWNNHASSGDRANLVASRKYDLKVGVIGSRVKVTVDGVDVVETVLPFTLSPGQTGIWCSDVTPVFVSDYRVSTVKPTAFVVMQFTKPYDDLYNEVIKPVCEQFGITTVRGDEEQGPGLIVADIARQISESKLIVAEITPSNVNVYYEVGYAHALNKPTILIAERETKLPFDVSPFRTIFYDNTIEGKRRIEEGFRKHLHAILSA
ncbi:MAG TPA: hypothetical protein VKC61_00650 [Pyrinomonadaceae bacterium]|nr:hypothetical protein [Pyrinomonadaceae bacterium]